MSDLYTELLVKKEQTGKDKMIKFGLIALIVIFIIGGLFIHPYLLIGVLAAGIAAYFMIPRTDLEFEYLFVNGEFDIDMIISKNKRKKVFSFSLKDAEIAAPLTSHRMDYYNGDTKMQVRDYSSGNPDHKRIAVVVRKDNASCKVVLEPDDHLAELMKNSAPSKVFLD